jgi:hypothetical protein
MQALSEMAQVLPAHSRYIARRRVDGRQAIKTSGLTVIRVR